MKKHAESRLTRLRNIVAKDGGFTLIEVLAVMVIVGLLAAIAIPQIGKFRERAYVTSLKSDARALINEAEGVYTDNGSYPLNTPSMDLSPHNTVAWGVPSENGVNFVITNSKANKSVTVTNSRLSGVSDGGASEGDPDDGEDTGSLSASYTVNPSAPAAGEPYMVTVTLAPADTTVEMVELYIDDQDLGGVWIDVTGTMTWSDGQANMPGQEEVPGVTTLPLRITTSHGVTTVNVNVSVT